MINRLPVELILKEFENLDYDSLINVCSIDRRFKAICDHHEDYLYKKMIARDFFNTNDNQNFINSLNIDTNIKPKKLYVLYNSHLIFKAINDHNLIELEKLLKLKNVNVKDKDGYTPLMQASIKGNLEAAKILVEKGADIFAKDKLGQDALIWACIMANLELVKFLVEKGAAINSKGQYDFTPLMSAIIEQQDLEIVKFLVEKGADVNARSSSNETALQIAGLVGELEIVKVLVEKGADVNAQDDDGKTARMIASENDHLEVAEYLRTAEREQLTRKSKIVRCKYCNKGYSSDEKLVSHLETSHWGSPLHRQSQRGGSNLENLPVELILKTIGNMKINDIDKLCKSNIRFKNICKVHEEYINKILFSPIKNKYGIDGLKIKLEKYPPSTKNIIQHILDNESSNILEYDKIENILIEAAYSDDINIIMFLGGYIKAFYTKKMLDGARLIDIFQYSIQNQRNEIPDKRNFEVADYLHRQFFPRVKDIIDCYSDVISMGWVKTAEIIKLRYIRDKPDLEYPPSVSRDIDVNRIKEILLKRMTIRYFPKFRDPSDDYEYDNIDPYLKNLSIEHLPIETY
jgi:ankyrin repeat protein